MINRNKVENEFNELLKDQKIIIEFERPDSLMEVKTNINAKWIDYQQDRK